MPQTKKRAARQAAKNRKDPFHNGPASSATAYNGPIRSIEPVADTEVLTFSDFDGVTMLGVGGASTYANTWLNSRITSMADWTTARALYQEYRVLGIKLEFFPKGHGGDVNSWAGATVNTFYPVVFAPFHGNTTAFSSFNTAIAHNGRIMSPVNTPQTLTVRMSEAEESAFISTATTPTDLFGIKGWFQYAGASTNITIWVGAIVLTYMVQFRGRAFGNTQIIRPAPTPGGAAARADDRREEKLAVVSATPLQQAAPPSGVDLTGPVVKLTRPTWADLSEEDQDSYVLTHLPVSLARRADAALKKPP